MKYHETLLNLIWREEIAEIAVGLVYFKLASIDVLTDPSGNVSEIDCTLHSPRCKIESKCDEFVIMKRKKGWAVLSHLSWEGWPWDSPPVCCSSSSSSQPPERQLGWAGWRWTVTAIQPRPTIRWTVEVVFQWASWEMSDVSGYLWLCVPAGWRPQCWESPVPHQDDSRHGLRLRGGGLPVDHGAQPGAEKSKRLFPASCKYQLSHTFI